MLSTVCIPRTDLYVAKWCVEHKCTTHDESEMGVITLEGRCSDWKFTLRVLVAAAGLSQPQAAWSLLRQSPLGNSLYW